MDMVELVKTISDIMCDIEEMDEIKYNGIMVGINELSESEEHHGFGIIKYLPTIVHHHIMDLGGRSGEVTMEYNESGIIEIVLFNNITLSISISESSCKIYHPDIIISNSTLNKKLAKILKIIVDNRWKLEK